MRHFFKTILLVFGVLIITFSCQKNEEIIEQQNTYEVPSIEAARLNFNENSNLGQLGTNHYFRTTDNSLNTDWDNSKAKKYKDEPQENLDILYTPLYLPTAGHAKSFVGTVEVNGEMQSKIFVLLYTESDNRLAFSGVILIYGLDGNIEYGYKYIEGQQVASGLPSLAANNLNRTGSNDDCEFPLDSMDCLIEWIGGDWFGVLGYLENDTVELLGVGDSSTNGFIIDPDLGNPSISIPALGDDPSIGGNPWWNDNTVSADGLAIVLALELEHLALPEAQWLLNEASQEQLQNIADFLNDNRVKDNDTPDELADNGINQNQMTEISQQALEAALELINLLILNPDASYEFVDTPLPPNALNFDSFSEAENYFNNLETNNYTHISTTFEVGSIRNDIISIQYNSFPEAKLVASIRAMIPDDNNDLECLDILNARVEFEGNNTFFDWVQFGSENPLDTNGPQVDIREDLDYVSVKVVGKMTIGFKMDTFSIRKKQLITVAVIYVYSTAEIQENHCCYFFYTNWANNNVD